MKYFEANSYNDVPISIDVIETHVNIFSLLPYGA